MTLTHTPFAPSLVNVFSALKLAVGIKPNYQITITHPMPENLDTSDTSMVSGLVLDQMFQLTDQLQNRKCQPHHLSATVKGNLIVFTSRIKIDNDHRAMDLMGSLYTQLCCDTHISVVPA